VPMYLSYLTTAHAEVGRLAEAWRCIEEAVAAVENTTERLWEAEIHRIAGEITLKSPELPGRQKAQAYFEKALAVARQQMELRSPFRRQCLGLLQYVLHRRFLQVGRIAVLSC
jgi:predicted ATPase